MILAFALFKYFPFGGLQRDFLRIALECQKRGHEIRVYTTSWLGDRPEGVDIKILPVSGSSNHRKMLDFQEQIQKAIANKNVDLLVGFNKMAGLDIYYAADTCFKEKALSSRGWWYRLTSRYKQYSAFEEAVFSTSSKTLSLLISRLQKPVFQKYYQTPDDRIVLLPPGISKDRCRPENYKEVRQAFRREFGFTDNEKLILLVGSGFKTKGLDRAIRALAALTEPVKSKTQLFVVGQDKREPFIALAKRLDAEHKVRFLSGRDDIPRFLLGADLLIHPAYNENTGTVLLEALVAGLPVLSTDVCGYAHYIQEADAGCVVPSPFSQECLNKLTNDMLLSDKLKIWQQNAINYSHRKDLYSMPEQAAEVIIQQAGGRHN
ncbi:glycosyltransferase family 4 protein [Endozoicomonas euniceicola]|uniref:Glycosyltransferase family 4 protein n=1 Tax=Endozoicomonas euniceicola TaxID=1234143 RepID=A0ABY6H1E4_9GAMM|nr:glycosyltransferase family 4 protein [Endozoicomonas euniceicola]UYM17974.1 glycosyltransferase family 4 protein [Endozoicomonas euniceicola]